MIAFFIGMEVDLKGANRKPFPGMERTVAGTRPTTDEVI